MIYDALHRLVFQAQMYGNDGSFWGHMGSGQYGTWMHPFGGIFILLILVALGLGLVGWFRRIGSERPESAVDILKTRLAKGEITKDEFDEMLKRIQ